jgi:hypothetical protein
MAKSASVVLNLPASRRKKGMVDEDADSFPHLIDAMHTAMMIYDEEGSKACQVFVDRQGLRNDSRTKALVQAMMEPVYSGTPDLGFADSGFSCSSTARVEGCFRGGRSYHSSPVRPSEPFRVTWPPSSFST